MEIILLADIEKLGKLGDKVDVKNGYGRNYLIPKGYALLATVANWKFFEDKKHEFEAEMDALRAEANVMKDKIQDIMVSIAVRSGDNNKLYGAVTTHMIASALEKEGIIVDRRKILLDAPIRVLGDFTIRVRLHADTTAEFALSVVSDRSDTSSEAIDEVVENIETVILDVPTEE